MKKSLVSFLLMFVLLGCLSVSALAENGTFVADPDGYLTASETADLDRMAEAVTTRYGCGIYLCIVDDMGDYGFGNVEQFAEWVFDELGCGVGDERTGILLVLSMAERDYDLDAHGYDAHYAFTDYGKEYLSRFFLDNFRDNDWYGGFADYIETCGEMLTAAEEGNPVDVAGAAPGTIIYESEPTTFFKRFQSNLLPAALFGIVIALIYCGILKKKMRSVAKAVEASEYVPQGGVSLSRQRDFYTHTTVVRQHIDRDSGGSHGGTHVSSGGHSHSSGKF